MKNRVGLLAATLLVSMTSFAATNDLSAPSVVPKAKQSSPDSRSPNSLIYGGKDIISHPVIAVANEQIWTNETIGIG